MNDESRWTDARRRRASMREVAELAHVAISSVSRVLSGHPDVSADMRERVLEAVRHLEYEPDFLAQSLRRGATLSVGWVIGDISNPLMAAITSGAESVLRAAGYSMLLMNSENDPDLDAAHIRFFQTRRVDGAQAAHELLAFCHRERPRRAQSSRSGLRCCRPRPH